MLKIRPNHNSMAHAVGIALLCLVVISVLTWQYRDVFHGKARPEIAYVNFGPLVVQAHGYAYRTSISIQSDRDDARWITRNTDRVGNLMHKTLANMDPALMRSPKGLASVQVLLKNNINATLDTARVQNVWITDFIWESDDN